MKVMRVNRQGEIERKYVIIILEFTSQFHSMYLIHLAVDMM